MEDEGPTAGDEEFSVRLRWPSLPERAPEGDDADVDAAPAAPDPATAPPVRAGTVERPRRGAATRTATVRTGAATRAGQDPAPAAPRTTVRTAATSLDRAPAAPGAVPPAPPRPAGSSTRSPDPADPSPAPARPPAPAPAATGSASAAAPESATARAFVDAFDRLAERLLDRLRTLRQDVDTDLSGLRLEVAALRQTVEDTSQALHLRQLHAGLDELRSELAGLRRAVLEVPELVRLSDEVAAIRGDLSLLFDMTGDGQDHTPSGVISELEQVVGRLSEEVGRMGERTGERELSWLVDEVSSIRTELGVLTKRTRRTVRLEPDQLELIADAVTSRMLDALDVGNRRTRRR